MALPDVGANEAGVLSDLQAFPEEAQNSSVAANMLHLARQLDGYGVIPRDQAAYVTAIRQNLMTLREIYPPKQEQDETTKAQDRRQNALRLASGNEG
jgi:hypothetical protein